MTFEEGRAGTARRALTSSRSSRSCQWLRLPPDVSYALSGIDSPRASTAKSSKRLPSLSGGFSRAGSSASGPSRCGSAGQLVPQTAARWWLREVTDDKTLGCGLYEVQTGLVRVHTAPSSQSEEVALMRAGTRFLGDPEWIGESVWLRVQTEDVPPPLFAGRPRGEDVREAGNADVSQFYARSGDSLSPLVSAGSPGLVSTLPSLWVEDNKQFITRIRNIDAERGCRYYSSIPMRTKVKAMKSKRVNAVGATYGAAVAVPVMASTFS